MNRDLTTKEIQLIEGNPVLVVIDILAGDFMEREYSGIPSMPDYRDRVAKSRQLIDQARKSAIPIVFIQEVHRPDLVDFGRELDGVEGVHCLESWPETELAVEQMDVRATDYIIKKRRYSAFFGTDFEILLRGLKADTLLLCGGLTDVCVHYTFVDAHQSDYFCRVVEDCVAGSGLEAHEASLKAMEYLQTGARCSLDMALQAISRYKEVSTVS